MNVPIGVYKVAQKGLELKSHSGSSLTTISNIRCVSVIDWTSGEGGPMPTLSNELISSLGKETAFRRILVDVHTDFVFAPKYKIIY